MQLIANWVVSILILIFIAKAHGLKCYICSVTENDADRACADNVVSLGSQAILDCNKKFCTIARVDYKDPKGKLQSITRNCEDTVSPDGVTEDSTYRTYYRSCKTDLCNSGSGKGNSENGIASLGDKSTIYVPGTAGGATIFIPTVLLLCSLALQRFF